MNFPRWRWLFPAMLAATAVPRLAALTCPTWVDEGPILRNVARFLSQRTILPDHFSYPPLFSYLAVPATGLAALTGGAIEGVGPREWALMQARFSAREMVIGPRLLSLTFALLAIVILRKLLGESAPAFALAALCLALSPVAVLYGAWALPDVAAGAFVLLAALLAIRFTQSPDGPSGTRLLVGAGAAIGVAAAFKYNAALAALSLAAAATAGGGFRRQAGRLAAAAAVSLAVFAVLAPTWVLAFPRALEGFLFEARNVRTARPGDPEGSPLTLLYRIAAAEPALLAALAMPALVFFRSGTDRLRLAILWLPALASVAVVSRWGRQDMNYFLPTMGLAFAAAADASAAFRTPAGRRAASGVLALLAMAGFAMHPPLPPWSGDAAAAALVRADGVRSATVIRFGLHTPAVQTPESREAALNDPSFGERALAGILERLEKAPQASRVIVFQDDPTGAIGAAAQPAEAVFVLTTREHLRRLQRLEAGDPAGDFARRLESWEVLSDVRGGEPWRVVLLRRP